MHRCCCMVAIRLRTFLRRSDRLHWHEPLVLCFFRLRKTPRGQLFKLGSRICLCCSCLHFLYSTSSRENLVNCLPSLRFYFGWLYLSSYGCMGMGRWMALIGEFPWLRWIRRDSYGCWCECFLGHFNLRWKIWKRQVQIEYKIGKKLKPIRPTLHCT